MRTVQALVYWLAMGLAMVGCSWESSSRPSILVIAVESLGFSLVPCQSFEFETNPSGFKTLCQESVRFSHAFTPSVMSQAALTSLLTGLYPIDHGVRNNGSDFLSAKIETVANDARRSAFSTTFLSGGPPIWSKSGLGAGFDFFDDRVKVDWHQSYRPFHDSLKLFFTWLDSDVKSRPFMAVIYVPDLQFPRVQTVNEFGEPRELSLQSQIREVDSSLESLFQQLRRRGLWDRTQIVLTGLNGYSAERRREEVKGTNLHSENTQVALFIKPAGKKRDLAMNWKVDANVSLVDVGHTIADWLGRPRHDVGVTAKLGTISLKGVLEGHDLGGEQRLILIESAWPQWRGLGEIRYALRKGSQLLFWQTSPSVYNTLTDPFELSLLSPSDAQVQEIVSEAESFFNQAHLKPWTPLGAVTLDSLAVATELWSGVGAQPELLASLERLGIAQKDAKGFLNKNQLQGWLARWYLQRKQWPQLLKLGSMTKNELWQYVALRNLGKPSKAPDAPCSLQLPQVVHSKKCDDEVFSLFLDWMGAGEERGREQYRERFLRAYRNEAIDDDLAAHNFAEGVLWDVIVSRPAGPSLSQLALSLPEHAKYNEWIKRRLAAANGFN